MTEAAGKEEGAPVRHKPDFYASENKRRWAVDLFKHGYGYTKVASILELSPYTVRDWNREYRAGRFRVQIAANQNGLLPQQTTLVQSFPLLLQRHVIRCLFPELQLSPEIFKI